MMIPFKVRFKIQLNSDDRIIINVAYIMQVYYNKFGSLNDCLAIIALSAKFKRSLKCTKTIHILSYGALNLILHRGKLLRALCLVLLLNMVRFLYY